MEDQGLGAAARRWGWCWRSRSRPVTKCPKRAWSAGAKTALADSLEWEILDRHTRGEERTQSHFAEAMRLDSLGFEVDLSFEARETALTAPTAEALELYRQANASREAGILERELAADYERSRRPVIDRLRLEAAEAGLLCEAASGSRTRATPP